MTPQIALTLAIVAGALILFGTEKLRVDIIALMVLLTVALTGLVGPDEVFAGFANSAVITVWAVYIVSGALFNTGVADLMGRFILHLSGGSEVRLIIVIMLTCGIISAFVNNVGAVAMLLPAVVSISRQTNVSASKLLIPLSFSSLLGGTLTLIGTPANILATSIVAERGLPTFSFFDFTPIGVVVFGIGILYMALIGRRLLPVRDMGGELAGTKQVRDYISEVRIIADSPLGGATLYEAGLGAEYDLTVIAVIRKDGVRSSVDRDTRLQVDDLLVIEGSLQNLQKASEELGMRLEAERHMDLDELDDEQAHMVEATLAPRSHIVGKTLKQLRFRDQYGSTALAIRREGEVITERLRDVELQFGDALLLQGSRHRMRALQEGTEFLVLEPISIPQHRRRKMPIAIGILVGVVGLVLGAGLHISTAMVIGAVASVLTGCLTMDEAYESIDWRTVFLVAGMLPLGTAMQETGTARFVADLLLGALGDLGPMAALGGIYLLAALITQPMSNAAAIVLVAPIAIDTAFSLGASHLTFTVAVVIGAATSFLTPVGHKANVLVFGPGGYKFFDFARVGILLTFFLFVGTMVALPILYPLFP